MSWGIRTVRILPTIGPLGREKVFLRIQDEHAAMEVDDDDLDVEMIAAVDHGISASYPSTAQVSCSMKNLYCSCD